MLRIAFDQMNLIKGDTLYRGLGQVLGWGNIRSLFPLIRPKQFVLHKAVPMCGTVYEWPVPPASVWVGVRRAKARVGPVWRARQSLVVRM